MTFKPEGLKLPDCPCFREKADRMNACIDYITGHMILEIRRDMLTIGLCPKADDYFIAAMIWSCLAASISVKEGDVAGKNQLSFEDYKKEYEEAFERLKPLVLERLVYSDGVMQGIGGKM